MIRRWSSLSRLLPLVVATCFCSQLTGCDYLFDDYDVDDDDVQGDEEDDDDDAHATVFCQTAEDLDDQCEAINGEDVAACAPFDAIDEACEIGEQDESCEAKVQLKVDCDAVFGPGTPECTDANALHAVCTGGA